MAKIVQAITEASSRMNTNADDIQELATLTETIKTQINFTNSIVENAVKATEHTVRDFEERGNNIQQIATNMTNANTIAIQSVNSSKNLNEMTDDLNCKLDLFKTEAPV